MLDALSFLGHTPGPELAGGSLEELLAWAIDNWQIEKIPKDRQISVTADREE